ncbi:MAG: DUF2783 domain-containing protein [Paracoccaceae bacterium]|nr:DUF2783 domain-containing protein [Paracoccaceae bacterium]
MRQDDKLGTEGDAVYAALLTAHEGLSEAESHRMNARLVLMLANQVGDADTVQQLIADARALAED